MSRQEQRLELQLVTLGSTIRHDRSYNGHDSSFNVPRKELLEEL